MEDRKIVKDVIKTRASLELVDLATDETRIKHGNISFSRKIRVLSVFHPWLLFSHYLKSNRPLAGIAQVSPRTFQIGVAGAASCLKPLGFAL